jgi:hypothetical protein
MMYTRFALLLLVILISSCVVNLKGEKVASNLIHVDVQCSYPGKSELNTFEHSYRKEIAEGRYAKTDEFTFDHGQQLLILNHALVLHFFEMPASFSHLTETDTLTHRLRIKSDTLDHTVTWRGSVEGLRPEKYHLKELVDYIDSMTRSTDGYMILPKSKSEQ